MNAATQMDNQYRLQRHVYDVTRKFYLLGRDTAINDIFLNPKQCLLEVGCGTGRNLVKLAKRYPKSTFYGLDAANVMLETAEKKRHEQGLDNIRLQQGLAQSVKLSDFHRVNGFNHIVMSYVLSMIPNWKEVVDTAIDNLGKGGELHIVDFSDQQSLPAWFRYALKTWLRWFHVHPNTEVLAYLEQVASTQGGHLKIRQLAGRYAFSLTYRKPYR